MGGLSGVEVEKIGHRRGWKRCHVKGLEWSVSTTKSPLTHEKEEK